jgi:hypothetical protein
VKIVFYLLSGVLILPGVTLAYFYWTVIEASQKKGLWDLIIFLVKQAYHTLVWGWWMVVPGLLIWLSLAFFPKYRILGAGFMALVSAASIVEFFVATGLPRVADDLFIPAISLVGLSLSVWLIWSDIAFWRT